MNLLNENEAKAFTDRILTYVKADDATASVNSDKLSHLRFANNDFLTSGQRVSRSANVTVWIDGKRGSAATNDLDDASLKGMVAEAEKLARLRVAQIVAWAGGHPPWLLNDPQNVKQAQRRRRAVARVWPDGRIEQHESISAASRAAGVSCRMGYRYLDGQTDRDGCVWMYI